MTRLFEKNLINQLLTTVWGASKDAFSASCLFIFSLYPISDLKIIFKSEMFDSLLLIVDEDCYGSMKSAVVLGFGRSSLFLFLCLVHN